MGTVIMELRFGNLPVTVTRRGRQFPSSDDVSVRERARVTGGDSSGNLETVRETCSMGTPTPTTTTNP
jgi:hypothetical protein